MPESICGPGLVCTHRPGQHPICESASTNQFKIISLL